MKLTAEQIQTNWKVFLQNIETHIKGDRKDLLLDFYKKYEERIILMPASHKKEYHNAFPGGYVEHVNRVVQAALAISELWDTFGADTQTYTKEELVFSAINHDLGKMGDEENESYIPQTDQWRKDKLGEDYMHTHDGLYDDANTKYLKTFMPETKPRTCLPYVLHQADMMAARIEFEKEWLPKLSKNNVEKPKSQFTLSSGKKSPTKNKALTNIKSEGLKNMLDNL